MNVRSVDQDPLGLLVSARKVADYAVMEGMTVDSFRARASYDHLGAVLADSVLQAGLSYASVVRPRIERILVQYPNASDTLALTEIVRSGGTSDFLGWTHPVKAGRFEQMVYTIADAGIGDVSGLRTRLREENFCKSLQQLHGIGPKTVDYMACLVGIESIAVDRHIRTFAKRAGVRTTDYYGLKWVFCFAADLLSVSRRGFDAWVWRKEATRHSPQLNFNL